MVSTQRTPLIVANWKMYPSLADTYVLADAVKEQTADLEHIEVVLCPPAIALGLIAEHVIAPRQLPHLHLGAQNMHFAPSGAFTGELSPAMVKEVAEYVIIGHSERTHIFEEHPDLIAKKLEAALQAHLTPILCIGEDKKENASGKQLLHRLNYLIRGLGESDLERLVVAYEPVWAIGTGDPATPTYAQDAAALIREATRPATRVLYGGSVDAEIARGYLEQPDIDGLLIGGMSVKAKPFLHVCTLAEGLAFRSRAAQLRG